MKNLWNTNKDLSSHFVFYSHCVIELRIIKISWPDFANATHHQQSVAKQQNYPQTFYPIFAVLSTTVLLLLLGFSKVWQPIIVIEVGTKKNSKPSYFNSRQVTLS